MDKTKTSQSKTVTNTKPNLPKASKPEEPKADEEGSEVKLKIKKESALSGFVSVIIVAVINVVAILAIFWIVSVLPAKAMEFNKVRNQSQEENTKNAIDISKTELETVKDDVDELESYYPEESGLVGFVQAMEALKEGSVTDYSFASRDPVRDETGALAVPIIIEFTGSWSQIDADLATIYNLPFILRFADVEAVQEPGNAEVNVRYGGFLYVNEKFSKN